jgi:hypothetical protein
MVSEKSSTQRRSDAGTQRRRKKTRKDDHSRAVLNMLKQEKSPKCGIEIKRQAAGWDKEYLLQVIGVKSFL